MARIMKKIFIGLMLVLPLSIFADEMITNGGFTSGMTGWTPHIGNSVCSVSFSSSECCSTPGSCKLDAYAYRPSLGYYGSAGITQTIKPTVSCKCKVMLRYTKDITSATDGDGALVYFLVNGKYSLLWIDERWHFEWQEPESVWVKLSQTYSATDTITGIWFYARVSSFSSAESNQLTLWVDDVSIIGTPVVGIEEQQLPVVPPQADQLSVIKDNICLSVSRMMDADVKIYDLCGREKEVVYSGTLSKGDYTFTPNIHKNGVYFVRLTAGTFKETKKLTIIK
jgi:hypothetical protein